MRNKVTKCGFYTPRLGKDSTMVTAELPLLGLSLGGAIDTAFLQEAIARAELEDEIDAFRQGMTIDGYKQYLEDLQLDAELQG